MERYLRAMLGTIQEMADPIGCADQAAHNLLLHEGKLEPAKRLQNFLGPVLTLGSETSYHLNAERDLVNRDGSVVNTVHQYDRHPELARLFEEKLRPSVWHKRAAKVGHLAERIARRLARAVHRLSAPPVARA
jgi:hypothetical protein